MQDAWYPEFSLLGELVLLPFQWVGGAVGWAVFNGQCAGHISVLFLCELENVISQTRILHRGYGSLKPPFCLSAGIAGDILCDTDEG